MRKNKVPLRARLIARMRAMLERRGYPRLQMMLLVALTGAAGFLCSYLLLTNGVYAMWARYMASVAVAYVVFLILLWLWLRTKAAEYVDIGLDLIEVVPERPHRPDSGTHELAVESGGSHWDVEADDGPDAAYYAAEAAGAADDLAAIPVFLLIFVLGTLIAAFSVVYSAPILFAELLLDGVLSATLYRRLKRLETRHWLETAVRRTIVPFIITAVILGLVGKGLAAFAPEAVSLGDALRTWREG